MLVALSLVRYNKNLKHMMQIELREVKGETKLILADEGISSIIPLEDPEAAMPNPSTRSQRFLILDSII